ncbi:MAG: hypothetical protein Q9187_001521, partial [Circinaria calcarea]
TMIKQTLRDGGECDAATTRQLAERNLDMLKAKFSQPSVIQQKFSLAAEAKANGTFTNPPLPYAPRHLLFYGSLMDPEILQTVLNLPEAPSLRDGSIKDYTMRMWGIYPALVPSKGSRIEGKVYLCETAQHFLHLIAYETGAYQWVPCRIELQNGDIIERGRVFVWAGKPDSKELIDGSFDFARYQQYFKPSVLKKQAHGGII